MRFIREIWSLLKNPGQYKNARTNPGVLQSVADSLVKYRRLKESGFPIYSFVLTESSGSARQQRIRYCIIGDEVSFIEDGARRLAVCDSAKDIGCFPREAFDLLDNERSCAFVGNITIDKHMRQVVTVDIILEIEQD